jgi:hypothetical protein
MPRCSRQVAAQARRPGEREGLLHAKSFPLCWGENLINAPEQHQTEVDIMKYFCCCRKNIFIQFPWNVDALVTISFRYASFQDPGIREFVFVQRLQLSVMRVAAQADGLFPR